MVWILWFHKMFKLKKKYTKKTVKTETYVVIIILLQLSYSLLGVDNYRQKHSGQQ